MSSAAGLACPRCTRVLGPESWVDAREGVCVRCKTDFEFVAFPALYAKPVAAAPQAAVLAADSVCFFHAENRAEAVCDDCGRLLCPVCSVPFMGRRICPSCIAAKKKSDADALVKDRVLFDGIALSLAGLPLLIFYLTIITAPTALGVAIYGWKKPGSVVRGRSVVRLWIAVVLSVLQIIGWVVALVYFLGRA